MYKFLEYLFIYSFVHIIFQNIYLLAYTVHDCTLKGNRTEQNNKKISLWSEAIQFFENCLRDMPMAKNGTWYSEHVCIFIIFLVLQNQILKFFLCVWWILFLKKFDCIILLKYASKVWKKHWISKLYWKSFDKHKNSIQMIKKCFKVSLM